MREVLISIRPEWVEKILNGEKTIEIRKTMPKCELPVKVYIYCTKSKPTLQYFYNWQNYKPVREHSTWASGRTLNVGEYGNGKVVAEFTLNGVVKFNIESIMFLGKQQELMQKSKLGGLSLRKYLGNDVGYAWGIDNLKIYDKPKELSKFRTAGYCFNSKNIKIKQSLYGDYVGNYNENSFCRICKYYDSDWGDCTKTINTLTRPPQSWCYVEKVEE